MGIFRYFYHLNNFAFPPHCAGCNRAGAWICEKCRSFMLVRSPPECVVCRRSSNGYVTHEGCRSESVLWRVVICWRYNHFGKAVMRSLKYKYRYSVVSELGGLAAEVLKPYVLSGTVLVPVPSTTSRVRERGFNQSEIIAKEIGHRLPVQTVNLLKKAPSATAQTGKSRYERKILQADALLLRDSTESIQNDTPLILIDDVCTTAATLNACALTLRQAGFKNISAAALFRGYARGKKSNTAPGARGARTPARTAVAGR